MAPKSTSHDNQRHSRGWFWRSFFSIIMGVAAWWAVDWFLSPRALYTLKYPAHFDSRHEQLVGRFQVNPMDGMGRLLLLQQWFDRSKDRDLKGY